MYFVHLILTGYYDVYLRKSVLSQSTSQKYAFVFRVQLRRMGAWPKWSITLSRSCDVRASDSPNRCFVNYVLITVPSPLVSYGAACRAVPQCSSPRPALHRPSYLAQPLPRVIAVASEPERFSARGDQQQTSACDQPLAMQQPGRGGAWRGCSKLTIYPSVPSGRAANVSRGCIELAAPGG